MVANSGTPGAPWLRCTAGQRKKKSRDPTRGGVNAMFGVLLPSVPFAAGPDGVGSWELAGIVGLCLARVWIMNRQSELVGLLDSNMMTRNQPEFWRLFRSTVVVAAMATVHRNVYKSVPCFPIRGLLHGRSSHLPAPRISPKLHTSLYVFGS